MTGALYDLSEVVAGVPPERISKCAGRLEIQPGSFFEAFRQLATPTSPSTSFTIGMMSIVASF